MTPFYSVDVSNQLGIYELEQYSIIRMLSKCFWVAGSFQEGGGSVRDTDPLAADHCSSCVATEMESMFTLDPSTCKMEYRWEVWSALWKVKGRCPRSNKVYSNKTVVSVGHLVKSLSAFTWLVDGGRFVFLRLHALGTLLSSPCLAVNVCRLQRGVARVRGLILFYGDSTITVSPVNIQIWPATIHYLSYHLLCVSQLGRRCSVVAQFIK